MEVAVGVKLTLDLNKFLFSLKSQIEFIQALKFFEELLAAKSTKNCGNFYWNVQFISSIYQQLTKKFAKAFSIIPADLQIIQIKLIYIKNKSLKNER